MNVPNIESEALYFPENRFGGDIFGPGRPCSSNIAKLLQSKHQASLGVFFLGKEPLAFMIPTAL